MAYPDTIKISLPKIPQSSKGATLHQWRSGATNLGYVLKPLDSDEVIAIDVPHGTELLHILDREGLNLSALLLTHSHHDHVNGLEEVVNQTGCACYAAEPFRSVPRQHVTDGLEWTCGGLHVLALETSGHSESDFSYLFPDVNLCFCADTLFQWGCGRLFAGPAERLWKSLCRLRSLPDETMMCCGHDFREDNLAFIQHELSAWSRADQVIQQIQESLRTDPEHTPFSLGDQKQTNPFLRADDPEIARLMGRAGGSPEEVFAELRSRRNAY